MELCRWVGCVCGEQVMVAEALDISRETYFAILMDRSCNGPVMVGSPQGGVDIEEVASATPELIFKVHIGFLFHNEVFFCVCV